MYSSNKIIRTISLIGACALAVTTARAVEPPPDGGYANANTAEGQDALFMLTTGFGNTGVGFDALFSNTTGDNNTANGFDALFNNTTGYNNTANGFLALYYNTTGGYNTATGVDALFNNTTGSSNTATGVGALENNTNGSGNTANGLTALSSNTTGEVNTANGFLALLSNTIGNNNTANGSEALLSNTIGNNNTANGSEALSSNRTGSSNTANGFDALVRNTHGNFNTAIGANAMFNNHGGRENIALGYQAGANLTGDRNIDIGNPGVHGEASTIRIGTAGTHTNTFIAGINGVTVAGGVGVIVDTDGHLGTVVSSARYKEAIKPMDKASEAILSLQPVTFRYKKELDPDAIPQFGLVAEDVAKVNPNLVARDEAGKPYTVRYEAVNAMLLNEFLKEHRKVEDLEASVAQQQKEFRATVEQQEKEITALTAVMKAQAAQIQKVSNEIELTRAAPRLVANDQ